MAAVRWGSGREAMLLPLVAVILSDTAQYYSGRAFGRRQLSPALSPKKTVEGAVGGFAIGAAAFTALAAAWWLPTPIALRARGGA